MCNIILLDVFTVKGKGRPYLSVSYELLDFDSVGVMCYYFKQ